MPVRNRFVNTRFLASGARILILSCIGSAAVMAAEADALAISANIQARHMPFGTILDPVFASPTNTAIVGYTRCGDSALWTGAYLAAEAFRYKVTQSPDALTNVRTALAGLKALVDVTGNNRLARCMVPADSPYAGGIASEEAHNTIHQSPPWIWVDNTSRDEVVGAFFGLGASFDLVDDAVVKSGVSDLATRLIGFISGHLWSPNDDISNTFEVRPEELQMLLQVARHVNPANKVSGPFFVPPVDTAVKFDVQSDDSYFKFNLAMMTFYNLVRIQNNGDNRGAYQIVWQHVSSQQNAFFDVIDRALNGSGNDARDAEIGSLLARWLARPKRDFIIDLNQSQSVPTCGNHACSPVPLLKRPPADFIWQVSPFQLAGGLYGTIEGSGIDYILPYWMARYYGVIVPPDVTSSAASTDALAPGELASIRNLNLPDGPVSVSVTDATGTGFAAQTVGASPGEVDFLVPDGMSPGQANFTFWTGDSAVTYSSMVVPIAPSLFTANQTGVGIADAMAVAVPAGNPDVQTVVPVFEFVDSGSAAVPITIPDNTDVFVTFLATGVRNVTPVTDVQVIIDGINVPLTYIGPVPGIQGMDQVIVKLITDLRGRGEANVAVTADGQISNVATINLQ